MVDSNPFAKVEGKFWSGSHYLIDKRYDGMTSEWTLHGYHTMLEKLSQLYKRIIEIRDPTISQRLYTTWETNLLVELGNINVYIISPASKILPKDKGEAKILRAVGRISRYS